MMEIAFTSNEAEGALQNGTAVEKQNSEPFIFLSTCSTSPSVSIHVM